MQDKLDELEAKYERLTAQLSDPEVLADAARLVKTTKERAQLEPVVQTHQALRQAEAEIQGNEELLADEEMREMAKEELARLRPLRDGLAEKLQILLLPKDPNDERNVILELRAGAGGDEAGLFAGELLRMYLRYAERQGWKAELADVSSNDAGGVKEAAVSISGESVYSSLKYESGVHRVQRVPATEAQGRIHTSTVTVAVIPEAEEIDVKINPAEVEMDVFRSTGSGGQSVNTTDSAVRLTHKPTGIVVKCQQEKSQTKNRAQAMKMLAAKLYERELEKQQSALTAQRRSQVGTGDRSEKIRTYNFPQDRLTDHRIGLTVHNLPAIMDGDIEALITACRTHFQAEALRNDRPDD